MNARSFPLVLPWLEKLLSTARLNDPRLRRRLLWVALAGLAIGLAAAWRAHPLEISSFDGRALTALLLAGVPGTLLIALEYHLIGRLLGRRIGAGESLEVTILGMTANLLPLPGGVLVRIAGLKAAGARLGPATALNLLIYVIWIAVAFCFVGLCLLARGDQGLAAICLVIGGFALAASIRGQRMLRLDAALFGLLLATRLAMVTLTAARIFLSLLALGFAASFLQASVISLSGVLSAMLAVVPAGLGVLEGSAAAIGPLVGLSMSAGFLALFLNRLTTLALLLPAALVLGMTAGRSGNPIDAGAGSGLPTSGNK